MKHKLEVFILIVGLSLSASTAFAQFDDGPESFSEDSEVSVSSRKELEVTSDDIKRLSAAKESKSEENMLQAVSRILGKDPKNLQALNTLAVFYFENDKPGLAKIILTRALADHPNVPTLHNNLGIIFLKENKQRLALASFRKSLELKSNYSAGAANLASIYLEYKDYSRAIEPLEDAYKSTRSLLDKGEGYSVEFANNYAVALAGLGELDKAEDIYSDIIEKNSRNTTVLLNYAILLVERLNKSKEAMSIINKIKFVSDDRQVLRRVEELEKKATSKE